MKEMLDRLTMGRALIIGFFMTSIYYFMIFDSGEAQRTSIQNAQAELQRVRSEIADTDAKLERAAEFQRASQSIGSSIQRLLSYIPANFRMGQLMKTISDEAKVAGLDIAQLAPKTITEPNRVEDFTELGVSMELKGQYDQVLSFMSNLTKQRQIFIFEKLELTSDSTDTTGLIKANAEIHAFSYQGKGNSNERE